MLVACGVNNKVNTFNCRLHHSSSFPKVKALEKSASPPESGDSGIGILKTARNQTWDPSSSLESGDRVPVGYRKTNRNWVQWSGILPDG